MAAITFVKKQAVVRGGAGRTATAPGVRISENGQLGFNSLALKALEGFELAFWGNDAASAGDSRKVTNCVLRMIKTPEKFPAKFKGIPGEWELSDFAKINWSQDKKNANVTLSGDLKTIGYDFKASGGQKFPCVIEKDTLSFTVPVGSLTPVPHAVRTKKEKSAPATVNEVSKEAVKTATAELEGEIEI